MSILFWCQIVFELFIETIDDDVCSESECGFQDRLVRVRSHRVHQSALARSVAKAISGYEGLGFIGCGSF